MKVAIAALHHELLTAWAEYRRQQQFAPEVLTLDFHTDVLCAARRGIPFPEPGVWQNPENVISAVNLLHHDEHFDWALRGGIISKAVIISLSPCAVMPEHPALEVRHDETLPDIMTMLNAPEKFSPAAAAVLTDEFLSRQLHGELPSSGFILDIDCDFLLCEKALQPEKHSIFDTLIRRAGMITLSMENDWVKILKLPQEKITGTGIAEKLEKYCYEIIAPDR